MSTISPFLLQLLQSQGGFGGGMQSNAPQIPMAQRSTGGIVQQPQQQRPIQGAQTNPLGTVTNLAQNGQKLYNMGNNAINGTPATPPMGSPTMGQTMGSNGFGSSGAAPTMGQSPIMGQGSAMPGSWSGQGMSPSMAGMPQGNAPANYMQGGNSGMFGTQSVAPQGFTAPGGGTPGMIGYNPADATMASPTVGAAQTAGAADATGTTATGVGTTGKSADGLAGAAGDGASSWLDQIWDFL